MTFLRRTGTLVALVALIASARPASSQREASPPRCQVRFCRQRGTIVLRASGGRQEDRLEVALPRQVHSVIPPRPNRHRNLPPARRNV